MSKKITDKLLSELLDTVQKTKSFTSKQLPEVAKEIITVEKVSAYRNLALGVIGIFISIIAFGYGYINRGLIIDASEPTFMGFIVGGSFLASLGFLIGGTNTILQAIDWLIDLHYSPKLRVITKLRNMLD